jgi:hypothetical protein
MIMSLIEYAPQYDPLRFLDTEDHQPLRRDAESASSDSVWGVNNSDFDSYAYRFGYEPAKLRTLLETYIGKDARNVGIDIAGGADGIALQQLLAEGFLGKALVTNFEDTRVEATKELAALDHLEGNLLERQTWEKIMDWQHRNAPDGFALVMHRPVGGLQNLRPAFYRGAMHLLIDMTKPGGILLLQAPDIGGKYREPYLEAIARSARSRDDIAEFYSTQEFYDPITCSYTPSMVCITKTPE